MSRILNRQAPILLALCAVSMLGAAYVFQYWGGLAPCELCWWQRYVYMAAIPVALAAFALDGPGGGLHAGLLLGLLALVFAGSAGLAGYHVGVEQGWWEGPAACSAFALEGSLEDMVSKLIAAPVVRCDEVAWSLFGVSMAGYNAIISISLAGVSGWAALNRLKANHD
ncbi:MAG: disulfide bond formation protein B [Alphaproteobacteria bacterium]|nr:MAG: disulfide bond formation protein B [Alphaproteobacteria bacterium]